MKQGYQAPGAAPTDIEATVPAKALTAEELERKAKARRCSICMMLFFTGMLIFLIAMTASYTNRDEEMHDSHNDNDSESHDTQSNQFPFPPSPVLTPSPSPAPSPLPPPPPQPVPVNANPPPPSPAIPACPATALVCQTATVKAVNYTYMLSKDAVAMNQQQNKCTTMASNAEVAPFHSQSEWSNIMLPLQQAAMSAQNSTSFACWLGLAGTGTAASGWFWLDSTNDAVDWGFSFPTSQWMSGRKPNNATANYYTGYSYNGTANSGWFAVLETEQITPMPVVCRVKA